MNNIWSMMYDICYFYMIMMPYAMHDALWCYNATCTSTYRYPFSSSLYAERTSIPLPKGCSEPKKDLQSIFGEPQLWGFDGISAGWIPTSHGQVKTWWTPETKTEWMFGIDEIGCQNWHVLSFMTTLDSGQSTSLFPEYRPSCSRWEHAGCGMGMLKDHPIQLDGLARILRKEPNVYKRSFWFLFLSICSN